MQISTALFLQTQGTSQEKKVSKEAVAKVLSQSLEPPSAMPIQLNSVKEVVTQLISTLASEAKSKGAVLEFLKQSPVFKNLGHFQSDVKSLINLLKGDTAFEKPLLLLQNSQKNIETIDPKLLKRQVQNSGIFFESTLAKSVTKENVTVTLKSLVAELKEHLAQTQKSPVFIKEITPLLERLSEPETFTPPQLQTTLKATLELLRQSVKEHLSFESPAPLHVSYALTQKIETLLQSLPLLASKVENAPDPLHVSQKTTTELRELINILKAELLKSAPPEMVAEVLPMMEVLLQNSQPIGVQTLLASTGDLSLEEQLLLLTNRLKQEITRYEPQIPKLVTFMEKSVQIEHKILSMLKPEVFLAPEVMQKLSINPADTHILSDIKGVLTSLSDKLVTSSNPNAINALETTQKLLTQIEYHQLVSYVGSSSHVYIPFAWDGLKEGSMMMKQTKEDAFHCQIDLDLEQYGKLNMMVLLSGENYLDMTIATQKNELRAKVNEHLSTLKKALNDVGIITQSVRLMEYKEAGVGKKEYFSDDSLNFGINITI